MYSQYCRTLETRRSHRGIFLLELEKMCWSNQIITERVSMPFVFKKKKLAASRMYNLKRGRFTFAH